MKIADYLISQIDTYEYQIAGGVEDKMTDLLANGKPLWLYALRIGIREKRNMR